MEWLSDDEISVFKRSLSRKCVLEKAINAFISNFYIFMSLLDSKFLHSLSKSHSFIEIQSL